MQKGLHTVVCSDGRYVISQAGVGYHCYCTRLRSSVNNKDILLLLVI